MPSKLTYRNAHDYIGKTVADLAAVIGPIDTNDGCSHTTRRLAATIVAIRARKAWAADVHMLASDGEWITLRYFDHVPHYLSALSATPQDRAWMFGLETAAKYPKPANESAQIVTKNQIQREA